MGLWGRVFGGSGDDVSGGVYEYCGWCGRGIHYGDTAATVNLNTERAAEESGETFVEVLDSEVLLILCAECATRLDAGTIRQALGDSRPPE